jgi:hypothetical protein
MNTIKTTLVVTFASLAVAAAPVTIASPEQLPAAPRGEKDDTVKLTGIVKAVAEKTLTLKESADDSQETAVTLTGDTKYVKAGQPAKADDVKPGVRVSLIAKQDSLGLPEAIEVTILPSTLDPKPDPSPEPQD